MVGRQRTSFDPETLSLLRQTLDDAWERLTPVQRAMTSRTLLAEFSSQQQKASAIQSVCVMRL